jgi:hypothetical protein
MFPVHRILFEDTDKSGGSGYNNTGTGSPLPNLKMNSAAGQCTELYRRASKVVDKCFGFPCQFSFNSSTFLNNIDSIQSVPGVEYIQNVPGRKVNILGGHSIGHSKQVKIYKYMCPIPNGFRDRAISLYRRATRHVLTRVAKCIDFDGVILENVLY